MRLFLIFFLMGIEELYKIFKQCERITTDSRDCPAGSLFFALKGASFDGNRFAQAALDKGCSYAIVDEKEYATSEKTILVDDVLKTLQQLAHYHRMQLGTKIICVTGTNGKTTTKELLTAVLKEKYNVMSTQGNLNNEIGVPKTLLTLTADHDIAVVEAGASHPGDIKILVDIIEPDYGIITNVGKAHLQGFGSFEGVLHTKGELYDYLRTKSDSKIFINSGDSNLMSISDGLEKICYHVEGDERYNDILPLVEGCVVTCDPLLHIRWKTAQGEENIIDSHLIGSYNIYNMLAAACVGTFFDVTAAQVTHALNSYVPTNNRSELEKTAHNTLIVDAYNANPTSMMAALKNFRGIEANKKMVILGDMKELGESSMEEHQKVVQYVTDSHFDKVWLVGDEFKKAANSHVTCFDDVQQVKDRLKQETVENHLILIKGSNSTKLYELKSIL